MDTKMDQPVTVEDYKEHGENFFTKYNYVIERVPGAKAEEVLKIMESLSGIVMKERAKEAKLNIGFNK